MTDTERWIECLTGDSATPMNWRAISDRDRSAPALNFEGSFADVRQRCRDLQRAGYGIHAVVNQVTGGLKCENVTLLRAAYIDVDDHHTTDFAAVEAMMMPTMRVNGRSRGHLYWALAPKYDGAYVESFASMQRDLIAACGSDPNVTGAERTMRVPGFYNLKNDGKVMVTLAYANTNRYTFADFWNAVPRRPVPVARVEGEAVVEPFEVRAEQARRYISACPPVPRGVGVHHNELKNMVTKIVAGFDIDDETTAVDILGLWDDDDKLIRSMVRWALANRFSEYGNLVREEFGTAEEFAEWVEEFNDNAEQYRAAYRSRCLAVVKENRRV